MKCKIPEISWHNRDPVLSVDIQPKVDENQTDNKNDIQRLASAGTDAHVLIWYMHFNAETDNLDLELAVDLARHQRAVNVVKWSPNGQLLASGDDESVIFIWKLKADTETVNILDNTNDEDKEVWLTMKILRGHMEDVYDLSWSPNSQFLVSGSVDNTAMLWDVHKGKSTNIFRDHKGFVQGVAWDPLNQYIATLSTDRYLRIFDIQTRKVLQRVNKSVLPVNTEHELYGRQVRLYHDDTLQTFFRRLTFTPDGKLLITPAGCAETEGATNCLHTTYIYSRYAFKQPAIVLPVPEQYTVAVCCCPVLYKLRAHAPDNKPVVPLPYRMIFAVATRCSIYFYDTQQTVPFGVISNIHYTRLTDISWSHDGRIVVVSSTDGFCSLITFDANELGEPYEDTAADVLRKEQSIIEQLTAKKSQNKQKLNKSLKEDKTSTNCMPESSSVEKLKMDVDENSEASTEKLDTNAEKNNKAEMVKRKLLVPTPIEIRRKPREQMDIEEKIVECVKIVEIEESATEKSGADVEKSTKPKLLVPTPREPMEQMDIEEKMDLVKETKTNEENNLNVLKNNENSKKETADNPTLEKGVDADVIILDNDEDSEIENTEKDIDADVKNIDADVEKDIVADIEKESEADDKIEIDAAVEEESQADHKKEISVNLEKNIDPAAEKDIDADVERDIPADKENESEADDKKEIAVDAEKHIDPDVEKNIDPAAKKDIDADVEMDIPANKENESEADDKKEMAVDVEKDVDPDVEKNIDPVAEKDIDADIENDIPADKEKESEGDDKKESDPAEEKDMDANVENDVAGDEEMDIDAESVKRKILPPTPIEIRRKPKEITEKCVEKVENKMEVEEQENFNREKDNLNVLENSANSETEILKETTNLTQNENLDDLLSNDKIEHEEISKSATPNSIPENYTPPNKRTPRRVALRTISTPKSKKKLLD